MRKLLIFCVFSFAGLAAVPALAGSACEEVETKSCGMHKQASCGPVDLNFRKSDQAAKRCEQALIPLRQTEVLPHLRRLHCFFYGDDTVIRFSAENYIPQMGPAIGDTIEVRNGSLQVMLFGHYRQMSRPSKVTFENLGPGRTVVLKCNGYGPA